MTPFDLLSDFPLGPGDPRQALLTIRLFCLYLADHVYELRDATDFKILLREVAEEAKRIDW